VLLDDFLIITYEFVFVVQRVLSNENNKNCQYFILTTILFYINFFKG